MDMINLKDLSHEELQKFIVQMGFPKFRAEQIFGWIYKGIYKFDDMKNIPKDLIQRLSECSYIGNAKIANKLESEKDSTIKYLLKLNDGNIIECVRMKYTYGNSICISTQVGCRMACSFCASTIGGLVRNLTAGEMIDQILQVSIDIGEKISHVVLMGSGEPFDNYEEVIKFLKMVNDSKGLNIGMRKVTISTCGLVDKIIDFADIGIQVNLAISLHAPNDELRRRIMPIARKYSLAQIIEACKYYVEKTNRRITFEYSLIEGVNSSKNQAYELSILLKGLLCHVNVIPVNKVKENGYSRPNKKIIDEFTSILEEQGIPVTVRRELGTDVNAACGQLRRSYLHEQNSDVKL